MMTYAEFTTRRGFTRDELIRLRTGSLVADAPKGLLQGLSPGALLVDRVRDVHHTPLGGRLSAERDLSLGDCLLLSGTRPSPGDVRSHPLEAVWQLVHLFSALWGGVGPVRQLGCQRAGFSGRIGPFTEMLRYELDITYREPPQAPGYCEFSGTATVLADGIPVYYVHDARLGIASRLQHGMPRV